MHSNRVVIGWVQSRCNSVGWCNAEEVVARAFGSHTPTHTARDAGAASFLCTHTPAHVHARVRYRLRRRPGGSQCSRHLFAQGPAHARSTLHTLIVGVATDGALRLGWLVPRAYATNRPNVVCTLHPSIHPSARSLPASRRVHGGAGARLKSLPLCVLSLSNKFACAAVFVIGVSTLLLPVRSRPLTD